MTAIQAVELELRKAEQEMGQYVDECGVEKSWLKRQHQEAVRKVEQLRGHLKFLKELYFTPITRN